MAGQRKQNNSSIAAGSARPSRTTRSTRRSNESSVPNVYESMLAEAARDDTDQSSDRPLKRRKVQNQRGLSTEAARSASDYGSDQPELQSKKPVSKPRHPQRPSKQLQTVENSSDSDESDFAFEDVDLDLPSKDQEDDIQDVSVSLEPESSTKQQIFRRKPISIAEKSHRVFVHKLHILCLLQHCVFVNGRCNNTAVHRRLRPLLGSKVVSFLNPSPSLGQFQRSQQFLDGLKQAITSFATSYRVISSGMSRPSWEAAETDISTKDFGDIIDRGSFLAAAKELEGSQDTGNQLFCALLRAVGVEARLVCSLPVLSFSNPGTKVTQPSKDSKPTVYVNTPNTGQTSNQTDTHDAAVQSSASIGKVPSARRRLGQPGFKNTKTPVPKKSPKPVRKLSYPVFWVEAFNTAHQKWVPVDPVVTHTVGKPDKLEPPLTYGPNQMTYVIAFEGDGVARDVTKRYAKAYLAKTRRHRVEATGEDGTKWWKTVNKIFRRRGEPLDRDQVEDSQLVQREAREGMPGNIQDFKDHPYYALERHLKRHEVLHPKREVGKVNAGTAANPRMEPVFRRQDVQVCRSADKWYRLGRVIQEGEQPIKQVPARVKKREAFDDDEQEERSETTGLYAEYQTEHYSPPPVQRGRITKNAYGNLDVYVPSMIPAGGAHIRHPLAQRAAKLLKVDYADAVTGFQFKGRQGTAIIDGVVVAEQFAEAVRAIIEGFENEVAEDESRARSLQALRLWKRFLVGLRIAERVKAYDDGSAAEVEPEDLDDELEKMETVQEAGGFFPGQDDEAPLQTAGQYTASELRVRDKPPKRPKRRVSSDEEESLASLSESDDGADVEGEVANNMSTNENEEEGGGFFVDEDQDTNGMAGGFEPDTGNNGVSDDFDIGGGFLPDEETKDDLFGEETDKIVVQLQAPEAISEQSEVVDGIHADDHGTIDSEPARDIKTPDVTNTGGEHDMPDSEKPRDTQDDASNLLDTSEIAQDDENTSDKGSMISHDPEDEDLEPDWLESD